MHSDTTPRPETSPAPSPATRRTVAIVGRPNVGKSALFNSIAGHRVAIVHEQRGVTRDRLIEEVLWRDQRFELIDTGGLGCLAPDAGEYVDELKAIDASVRRQAEIAVQDAAAIIFVTDLTCGVIPQDEEVADFLRKSSRPVFLAANKADNDRAAAGATDFERFGFPVYAVSALHKSGLEPLLAAALATLPTVQNASITDPLKVTIVGRPNAGKSSLINRMLHSDRLIVSPVPGTTRDSIDIPFVIGHDAAARHYILTDTAGIRRVGKIRTVVDRLSLVRAEKSIEDTHITALVIDATQGPTEQDKKIAASILERRKGCVLIVNKWDLMSRYKTKDYIESLHEVMPFLSFVPIVFTSASNGFNIRKVIEAIDLVAANTRKQLPTGMLNRAIMNAAERVQPPFIKGKRFKIYYATQTRTQPLTVTLFVNSEEKLTVPYRSFLVGELRRAFGLEGAPIEIRLRGKHAENETLGRAPSHHGTRTANATPRHTSSPRNPSHRAEHAGNEAPRRTSSRYAKNAGKHRSKRR